MMLRKDPFGHLVFFKRILISLIGWITWPRYNLYNKTHIEGTEFLEGLRDQNVLFVSNHQTYFADVIAMLHVFCSVKRGYRNNTRRPWYLFRPRINTYFVAAEETMRNGWLPRLFAYVGSVSIQRTFRDGGKDVNRKVRMDDISNITKALDDGWVITFPQGTTKAYAPGRRGVSLIIKKQKPIVVPVVIDGFRRGFDKRGLRLKKKGVNLSIRFKQPLDIDYEGEDADEILKKIMYAIEQSETFQWAGKEQPVL